MILPPTVSAGFTSRVTTNEPVASAGRNKFPIINSLLALGGRYSKGSSALGKTIDCSSITVPSPY